MSCHYLTKKAQILDIDDPQTNIMLQRTWSVNKYFKVKTLFVITVSYLQIILGSVWNFWAFV